MKRIRGKKRMEIIKNFIEGKEDPEYEVIPTVTDGKYFVRPRKNRKEGSTDEQSDEEQSVEEQAQRGEEIHEKQKQKPKPKSVRNQKLESRYEQKQDQQIYDPTISYQILEQLKLLGEEQRLKRTKKEQKKLVKHQIQKQLKQKHKREQESSDEYDYDYEAVEEEQPKNVYKERAQGAIDPQRGQHIFQPIVLRRKVNLNK